MVNLLSFMVNSSPSNIIAQKLHVNLIFFYCMPEKLTKLVSCHNSTCTKGIIEATITS